MSNLSTGLEGVGLAIVSSTNDRTTVETGGPLLGCDVRSSNSSSQKRT